VLWRFVLVSVLALALIVVADVLLRRPRPAWRNGYVESFNSRVRDECLNINMFWSLAQARVVISALGYQAPAVYAAARTHQ
jgi:Integrase core domain